MNRLWFVITRAPFLLLYVLEFIRQLVVANAIVAY